MRSSWVATTTIRPSSAMSRNSRTTSVTRAGSRCAVGSSASTRGGSRASARASATRWRSPPDRLPGRYDARAPRPTRSSSSPARRRDLEPRVPAARSGTSTFSSAVRLGTRLKDWNTMPTWLRRYAAIAARGRRVTSMPSSAIDPCAGRRIAASDESSVVLPQPLAPSRRASSPPATSSDRPSIGRTVPHAPWYSTVRSWQLSLIPCLRTRARDRRRRPGAAR